MHLTVDIWQNNNNTHTAHGIKKILQDPSTQVALPNDEATFTCTVQTDGDYYAYINGTPTTPGDIQGITITTSELSNDVHVVTIVIVAYMTVNTTTVQCVVANAGNDIDSGTANLWIASKRCTILNQSYACIHAYIFTPHKLYRCLHTPHCRNLMPQHSTYLGWHHLL